MSTEPSIFTRIINREIPATIVYEDDFTIAFLTIEPISKGHTLVVPKKPVKSLLDADEHTLRHLSIATQKVGNALVQSGLGTAVNIIMNCGIDAGQEVFHAHFHVVPRNADDGALPEPPHVTYTNGEAFEIGNKITKHTTT
jgi:histidine triad (HIT) family protein